jgi:spectinomycin phosphotransferase
MLEKPDLHDVELIACLREAYGLSIARVEFLPLGADINTAVYRATDDDSIDYFVKLRSGAFNEMTIIVPKLLHDQGMQQVIAPLPTQTGALWTPLRDFKVTVSPFVEGRDGSEIPMTDQHWLELGRALKTLHMAQLPSEMKNRLPRETYSDQWRESVRRFQAMVETDTFADPVAAELAAFLQSQREIVSELVTRAETLAAALKPQSLPFVLCHADIHVWNVLIDTHGRLYVVDWDTLILAPKERDLMFIGGGLYVNHRAPAAEARLFYQGYGEAEINQTALAYYRFERIVQDVAAYCEQLLLTDEGGSDRANGLRQLTTQFLPGEVIDIAFKTVERSG